MNKTMLRDHCLQVMGITQWKMRDACDTKPYPYLFCYQALTFSDEKKQMLERLMQALKWPQQQVAVHDVAENDELSFEQKLKELQPRKVVIFGSVLAQKLGYTPQSIIAQTQPFPHQVAIVSSLDELMNNKNEKKQTWQTLQPFIHL